MFTSLLRILRYGWQHFWRNSWLSIATLAIMIMALIVFQGLIVFSVVTKTAIEILKDKIDISVYFKNGTPETEIFKIKEKVEGLAEVKSAEYISQDKALTLFKERHEDDDTILQALGELEENPLSAVINIKAHNPEDYAFIASQLDRNEWRAIIDKITYRQNQIVIDRLGKIVNITGRLGLILTVLLASIAILVTFNTVSLAIYSNREEIGIMRLVGAPNRFITGPYVVEGAIYGIIAVVVSLLIVWPLLYGAAPYLKFFITDFDLREYLLGNFWKLLGYQLIFGLALGIISSNIAIRKYLKI